MFNNSLAPQKVTDFRIFCLHKMQIHQERLLTIFASSKNEQNALFPFF
jgi:hypothetical protein